MNIIALICARGGSKGVPNKNIKLLAGKPLIVRTIDQVRKIKKISKIIVSTDSKKISKIAKDAGADVPFIRPKHLAKDNSPEWLVWRHALIEYKKLNNNFPDVVVIIPVTSPLRNIEDLKKCIKKYQEKKSDIVITITDANRNPYFNMVTINKKGLANLVNKPGKHITRRQDSPNVFDMTTVAYVTSPKFILKKKSIFNGKVGYVHIPKERALDIDTSFDFKIAELLLSN